MDKIEKIRQEIERHRQAIRVLNEHTAPEQISKTCAIFRYSDTILSALLSFIDSLQVGEPMEILADKCKMDKTPAPDNWKPVDVGDLIMEPQEPSEDLEKEITYFNEWMKHNGLVLNTAAIAHYFAKWGAEHLKK